MRFLRRATLPTSSQVTTSATRCCANVPQIAHTESSPCSMNSLAPQLSHSMESAAPRRAPTCDLEGAQTQVSSVPSSSWPRALSHPHGHSTMARSMCVLTGEGGIGGVISLQQALEEAPTVIDGTITGLTPGRHGFHIHVFGDFSKGMVSAGGIFNPFGKNHGAPEDEERMVGDLGNIEADDDGKCTVHIEDRLVKLIGPHSVIGRSLVLKAGEDDLGRGGHELSMTSGNSGPRIAGGVIGIAPS